MSVQHILGCSILIKVITCSSSSFQHLKKLAQNQIKMEAQVIGSIALLSSVLAAERQPIHTNTHRWYNEAMIGCANE